MFKQARQNRIFQDVIDQIQEAIIQGKLKTGDKLPAERVMKEIFKTSRGTLREALRVLEQKGLISIKTGTNGGAIVNNVTSQKVSESLDLLIRSQRVSLKELAHFREDIEGIVTGLAARMATVEDVNILKVILEQQKMHMDGGLENWDDFINSDNDFHMAIAGIARNPLYESILKTVHENINKYYNQFLPKNEKLMRENYQDMCNILNAIEKKDPEKAQLLAKNHVRRFTEFMETKELDTNALSGGVVIKPSAPTQYYPAACRRDTNV